MPPGTNYPMPVTLISSYLGYAPASAELTLACVRAVHALGKCSANLTGHISFASSLHQVSLPPHPVRSPSLATLCMPMGSDLGRWHSLLVTGVS